MALTSTGWYLHVTLSDTGGNHSVLRYDLTAADAATAATDATAILAALNAVTDAAIAGYSLGERFEDSAAIYGGGEIENTASVMGRIDNVEVKWANLKIPAPADGIFKAATGPDYNVVDAADTDLQGYLTLFVDGEECYLSDGENLLSPGTAGNVYGKRIHRKSRKG